MSTENAPSDPDDLSPEEARRQLVRLITRQDIERNAEIYEELEHE